MNHTIIRPTAETVTPQESRTLKTLRYVMMERGREKGGRERERDHYKFSISTTVPRQWQQANQARLHGDLRQEA